MMLKGAFKLLGLASIFSTPALAQFGVPQKRGGTGFEDLQEMAKEQMGGKGMADLANLDSGELMKMIEETMNDPQMMEYMKGLDAGMGEAMEQISKMTPEEIAQLMEQNLKAMTSPEMLNSVLEQKDDVLQSLLQQGLITEEQMAEFENDPQKFQETMADAFGEINKIMEDPSAIDAATKIMQGVSDIVKNPAKAMGDFAQALTADLDDDDKIEEARLQLLENPDVAGNPMLASLFQDEQMQELLKDPIKWREQVKKGKDMIGGLGGDAGAGIGEL